MTDTENHAKMEFMDRLLTEPEMIPYDLSVHEFENLLDILLFNLIDSADNK